LKKKQNLDNLKNIKKIMKKKKNKKELDKTDHNITGIKNKSIYKHLFLKPLKSFFQSLINKNFKSHSIRLEIKEMSFIN
jgi:hypothetical protein